MAAANTKHLEDKLARYEKIMSECRRCKTALASEEVEDDTEPLVPTSSASKSGQTAPKVSYSASTLSSKKLIPTPQRVASTRSSKQNTSSSRPIPSASSVNLIDLSSSTSASASRREKTAADPPRDTVRPSSRSSKPTTVKAVPSLPDRSSIQQTSTHHSLHLRPTSLEPSISNTITLTAPPNQPYASKSNHNSSGSVTGVGRPRKDPHKQPSWAVPANKMLREVPLGWVWLEKLLEVDKSMLAAVATDIFAVQDDKSDPVEDTQDSNRVLTLVRGFAHRHSDKRVNFQHFLLVCLCIVLPAQTIPRKSVVETLQICISDTSEANVSRYFTGAKWANEMICKLFFAGWRYRAIDLMVIWDRSIAMYGKIASHQSTEDYFVSHLTQSEYCEDVQEIPNRVHTTIPWIVKKELGDKFSYEMICKALCYSYEYFLETRNLHSSTRSSFDADILPSQERSSISRSLSFCTARQSADNASGSPQLDPTRFTTSGDHDGAAYLQSWSQIDRQRPQEDDYEDSARRDRTASQIAADPQKRTRVVPDWSATPLGNPDTVRQRRPPDAISKNGELLVSSSLGESTPATQRSKRPLPSSPTSQLQPDNNTRRRQHERETPSREETGSSYRSGKKDSHKQRGRT